MPKGARRFAAVSLLLAGPYFTPTSWSAAAQEERTIHAGETIHVRLPVGDPQKTAVAFDLEVETSGPLTIEARSYDFDTLLKVSRVGPNGALVPVGQDDDGGFGNNSRLGFEAEGGVRYRGEVQPAEIFYCEGDLDLLVAAGKTDGPDPQAKQQGDRAYWEAVKARAEDSARAECRVEGLRRLGAVRRSAGAFGEAKPLAYEALALAEKELAPEHLLVASALDLLASVQQDLGSYTEAQPLFERALAMREKQLGPEHPDVAQSLNNLAVLLLLTGSYAEARPLFERCLAINERLLGPEDPIIALLLNNLGVLLGSMGSYTEARSLAERALAIQERQLGPEHPVVAQSLGNVAYLLQSMGSYAEAKPLFERAQAIYEKQLGPEHPEVARNLNNLALLLKEMGSYIEARPLFERALAIREKQLGPDHPYVASTLNNLGMVLQALGLFHEAKQVFERAMAIYDKQPGPGHPDAAKNLSNLALLLQDMGFNTEAKRLLGRALAMFEKQLDPEHPFLARAHKNLGVLLARTGSRSAALTEALRAEEIGRNHVRLMARALAERPALRYSSVRDSGLDLALSLVVEGHGQASGSGRRVWDALVRSRALVLDEMASRHRAYGEAQDPLVADLTQRLIFASGRLANLMVRGPGHSSPDQYRKLLDDTRREEERIEQALAEKSLAFRQELSKGRLGLDDVVQNLPPGSALLAFAR